MTDLVNPSIYFPYPKAECLLLANNRDQSTEHRFLSYTPTYPAADDSVKTKSEIHFFHLGIPATLPNYEGPWNVVLGYPTQLSRFSHTLMSVFTWFTLPVLPGIFCIQISA